MHNIGIVLISAGQPHMQNKFLYNEKLFKNVLHV